MLATEDIDHPTVKNHLMAAKANLTNALKHLPDTHPVAQAVRTAQFAVQLGLKEMA